MMIMRCTYHVTFIRAVSPSISQPRNAGYNPTTRAIVVPPPTIVLPSSSSGLHIFGLLVTYLYRFAFPPTVSPLSYTLRMSSLRQFSLLRHPFTRRWCLDKSMSKLQILRRAVFSCHSLLIPISHSRFAYSIDYALQFTRCFT